MPNFVPVFNSTGAPVFASNGTQRVACVHLAQWLVTFDALQVARGRGHVTYYQTMGGADASAGTHDCGSAWDMSYTGIPAITDAREMGAADWPRLHSNGWVGAEHVHGLIHCGDNGCNLYQYAAYLSGRNGLGKGGLAGPDPLSRPATLRTWQQGIEWAKAEIARLTTPTVPAPVTQEEHDMKDLIIAAFDRYLGITPSDAQVSYWVTEAARSSISPKDVASGIANSPEGLRHSVVVAYQTHLKRDPSPSEVDYWAKQGDWYQIDAKIAASPEAKKA
jgi:hypothetical protein